MPHVETVAVTAAYRTRCEDRVAAFTAKDRTVVVVADGAGGMGSGDIAAEFVVREIESAFDAIQFADQWSDLLRQLDFKIPTGESTAVVVDIRPYGIAGASVGDSQAWIVAEGEVINLTQRQNRKPLLGSGDAAPVSFQAPCLSGTLLLATDGLFDYARRDAITRLVSQPEFHSIPRSCIELVRLPSGELWDDVGVVVARNLPHRKGRRRYEIYSP